MKIKSFDLLNEDFTWSQPCNKEEFDQIEAIIKKMMDAGILEKRQRSKLAKFFSNSFR